MTRVPFLLIFFLNGSLFIPLEAHTCNESLTEYVKGNFFLSKISTIRGILTYSKYQHPDFSNVFDKERPIHIMDLGAGDMVAAREMSGQILATSEKPGPGYFSLKSGNPVFSPLPENLAEWIKVTAISYIVEDPNVRDTPNFVPFIGNFFEDIPNSKLLAHFGKVDVFVDYWGVIAYTAHLDLALQKILQLSRLDSQVYLRTRGKNQPGLEATIILTNAGVRMNAVDWLKQIPGLHVEEVNWAKNEASVKISFTRHPDRIVIPKLIMNEDPNFTYTPPGRSFREL
jgi:hypothetical protein